MTEESTSGAEQMVQDKAQQAKEQVKQATRRGRSWTGRDRKRGSSAVS